MRVENRQALDLHNTAFGKTKGIRTRLAAMVALGSAMLLAGCMQQPVRADYVAAPGDGAVIFKLTQNLENRLGLVSYGVPNIAVKRLEANGKSPCYRLTANTLGMLHSAVFGGALPPGIYEFPTVGAGTGIGGPCGTTDSPSKFARFMVEAGKLSFLGTIEITASNDRHRTFITPEPAPNLLRARVLVDNEFPDLSRFSQAVIVGWVPASMPPGLDAARQFAVENSFGLLDPSETSDGRYIFGSRAGVIREWAPGESRPIIHDTGVRTSLELTTILPDGHWLVGGEGSALLASADHGQTWTSVSSNLPFGAIVGLNSARSGIVYVTLFRGDTVSVFSGRPGLSPWRKIASYTTTFNHWTSIAGVLPRTDMIEGKLVTLVPSRQIAILDPATGKSVIRNLPGSAQVFSVSADGVLHCRCNKVLAVNPYESHDFGQTWISSAASRWMMMPAMRDARHGVAWVGAMMGKRGMVYTNDGGATWTPSTETPDLSLQNTFYSNDGKRAFATNGVNQLWESDDDGRSWHEVMHLSLPTGELPGSSLE